MGVPLFPYNNAVPQAAQKISSTQNPILNNFQSINELINVNHVGFSDAVNFGKHTVTTFSAQVSPTVTTSSQMSLYAAAASTTNGIELFYQYPSNGSIKQLTGGTGTSDIAATSGFSYLPGSIIMKWGLATGLTTGVNVITFPTGGSFPAFGTSIFNVAFSTASNYTFAYNGPYISAKTTTGFTITAPSTISSNVYWFAIGI